MKLQSLSGQSLRTIAAAFNQAFDDYFIPIQLTDESLSAKIISENISMEFSVGVFADEKLVAFILTGIDFLDGHGVAYNAGTGVIPEFRGMRLTQMMYEYLIPLLQKKRITRHQLEVITCNTKALKAYQRIGFDEIRKLCCLKGTAHDINLNSEIRLSLMGDTEVINQSFFNFFPTYQNTLTSIERDKRNYVFISAVYKNIPVGFIVYAPANGRVKSFAVHKSFRKMGIGSRLFNFVQKEIPRKEISVINIDASDHETVNFLKNIGLTLTVEQYEMTLVE